jgi:hypothetical protein
VLLELVGVVLGGGEGETGGNDTLDAVSCQYMWLLLGFLSLRRVVCQVQEQGNTLHAAVLLEISCKESARLQVDTHGTEDDGEVVGVAVVHTLVDPGRSTDQAGLSANLGSDFVVGKTGGREDGDLLTTRNRVHGVDGRDTGGDHLLGVDLALLVSCHGSIQWEAYSGVWVDRATVDVEVVFSKNLGALVDGLSRTVENTTQHVLGHTKLQAVAGELDFGLYMSDTLRASGGAPVPS